MRDRLKRKLDFYNKTDQPDNSEWDARISNGWVESATSDCGGIARMPDPDGQANLAQVTHETRGQSLVFFGTEGTLPTPCEN